MNPEINQKLKELQELIKAEEEAVGRTMADFFGPSANKILEAIANRVMVIVEPVLSEREMIKIKHSILSLDAESLLNWAVSPDNDPFYLVEVKSILAKDDSTPSRIAAIKKYKEHNPNIALRDAKDLIDSLCVKMNLNK